MNQYTNIPEELKQLPQWVCHRSKVPFNPVTGVPAKAGQPVTWARFEDAVNASSNYDGIGFEFNKNGMVGIDLDKVITEDGTVSTEAAEIVTMLDSYTEYSPSGKGLHIFVKGDIPVDGRKKDFIEMYKAKRYFTMTGNVYGELTTIKERSEQVVQLFNKHFSDSKSVNSAVNIINNNPATEPTKDYLSIGLAKDAVFKALWDGEYQSEKCTSESEADLALMGKLLYCYHQLQQCGQYVCKAFSFLLHKCSMACQSVSDTTIAHNAYNHWHRRCSDTSIQGRSKQIHPSWQGNHLYREMSGIRL